MITLGKRQAESVEKRAARALKTMGEICEDAGVAHSTWSRAKERGTISVTTLRRLNVALERAEAS